MKGCKNIYCFLAMVLGLFMPSILLAQDPVFNTLDYTSGLPSNAVYSIIQDSKGYIWLGHDKGLSRYNGQSLQHYASKMPQSRGLSNLLEDNKGRIWCQNFSGEIYFTSGRDLVLNEALKSTGNIVPFQFFNGSKIITTRDDNLIQYDIEGKDIVAINAKNVKYASSNVLTQGDEIFALSRDQKLIICYKSFKELWSLALPADIAPHIFIKSGNQLLTFPRIGTSKIGIFENGRLVQSVSLGVNTIIQNVVIINGNYWISTTQGAYCYDSDFNLLNNGKPYFADCNVSSIMVDAENTMWFSTLNKGVLIVSNLEVHINATIQGGLTTAAYFSSIDKVIVGSGNNQIFEINPENNSFQLLRDFKIKNDVIKIYNDVANDRIWLASDKMYALKGSSNDIDHAMTIPMKDICYLDKGYYALASPEGISLFQIKPDTTDQYFATRFTSKPIPYIHGKQLLPGSEGRAKSLAYDALNEVLYASNYKGLFSWNAKGIRTTYQYKGENIYASSIVVKGNTAYVGTYSGKLFIIEKGKIIKSITGFRSLIGRSIVRVEGVDEFLWLLFENAVVRYHIFKNQYTVFTVADGLPNVEIKDIAVTANSVFLATRSGLVYFDKNIRKSAPSPRLLIDEVSANHQLILAEEGKYYLNTHQNDLEIKLSLISFRNNSGIGIYYNINNQDWRELTSADRILNLVGLAPGNYEVKFKAVTWDGKEIPATEILRFRIAAPLYTRWWFILIVLLLLSAMVFYFMRFRIYELKKEAEFKVAREKLERELQISTLASIKSQMNPHFVFNALNTVQSYIFTNDRDNATDYLNKFSELTRMILDMSNKEKITIAEEIKALKLYLELEKRRFEDAIDYQIVVHDEISADMMQIPSMLVQPYVENAIKHGLLHKKGEKKIKIEFVKEEHAVVVFIDDNGIGRKKSQELKALKPSSHRSFASEANKKRLQLLNQNRENTIDIEYLDKLDSYGNPLGTMVVLAIPLNF